MDQLTEFFLRMFPDWFFAVLHPLQTCSRLLSIEDEQERFKQGAKIWLASFLITLGIDLSLYHSIGIEWDTVGFHIFSLLCLTGTIIALGFAIQFSLKWFGINSTLSEVTAMYVAYFMSYEPLVAILSYLSDLGFLNSFRKVSAARVGFLNSVALLWKQAQKHADGIDPMIISSSFDYWVFLGLVCLASAVMAITVAERYNAPRIKSFSAIAFATSVLIVPIFVMGEFLELYNLYTFVH